MTVELLIGIAIGYIPCEHWQQHLLSYLYLIKISPKTSTTSVGETCMFQGHVTHEPPQLIWEGS
jgi:hypothetical protein